LGLFEWSLLWLVDGRKVFASEALLRPFIVQKVTLRPDIRRVIRFWTWSHFGNPPGAFLPPFLGFFRNCIFWPNRNRTFFFIRTLVYNDPRIFKFFRKWVTGRRFAVGSRYPLRLFRDSKNKARSIVNNGGKHFSIR